MDCKEFAVIRDHIKTWQTADFDENDMPSIPQHPATKAILQLRQRTGDYQSQSVLELACRFIELNVSPVASRDFEGAFNSLCEHFTQEWTLDLHLKADDLATQIDWWIDPLGDWDLEELIEERPIPLLKHTPPRDVDAPSSETQAAKRSGEQPLTENDRDILVSMLELNATSTKPESAKVITKAAMVADEKKAFGRLKDGGYVKPKKGPSGGFYLTESGQKLASEIG